jgi:hypothetical protein
MMLIQLPRAEALLDLSGHALDEQFLRHAMIKP